MNMTLREICDATGVSRRAVQGYERAVLVSSSGKNRRGYLLYDTEAQERIKKIKFFQQIGFTIKEIKDIIDVSNDILKVALVNRVERLKVEKRDVEGLISKTYELIEKL